MTAAPRLEDFAAPPPRAEPLFTAGQLAEEYRRGHAEGEACGRGADMAELTQALYAVAGRAETHEQIRRSAIHDTLQALVPVLQALLCQLSDDPEGNLTRLITAELERLCLAGISPTCRIAANAALIRCLGDRIDAMGLDRVTLAPGDQTEITFAGGRITFDPAETTTRIAALLAELSPAEEP